MNFDPREAPETDHKVQVPRASSDLLADRKVSAHLVVLANSDPVNSVLRAQKVLVRHPVREMTPLAHHRARPASSVRVEDRIKMALALEGRRGGHRDSEEWGEVPAMKAQTRNGWSSMPCSLMPTVMAN